MNVIFLEAGLLKLLKRKSLTQRNNSKTRRIEPKLCQLQSSSTQRSFLFDYTTIHLTIN